MIHDFRSVSLFIPFLLLFSVAFSEYSEPDSTYSGLYKILNCNSRLPARLHPPAKQLQAFLSKVWASNKALLDDIASGTNSIHGYEALFKTNSSVSAISFTLRSMRYGGSVGPSGDVPTLICLDSYLGGPEFQTLFKEICTDTNTIVATIPNSTHIAFCPNFFEISRHQLDFPVPRDCPVTKSNRIQESPHPLMHNGYPIFLTQLLRLYVEHGLIEGGLEQQVESVQDCINLDAAASVKNVANWAIYAASVFASCDSWPTVPSG